MDFASCPPAATIFSFIYVGGGPGVPGVSGGGACGFSGVCTGAGGAGVKFIGLYSSNNSLLPEIS